MLIAHENPFDLSVNPPRAHKITLLSAKNMSKMTMVDVGMDNKITGMSFLGRDSERIIVQLISAIPFKNNDFTYGHDRFIILNLKTGKSEKTIPYAHARGVSKPLFSADGKYLVCLFRGEDEDDELGILDVLDPDTGKILWHLEGSDKQPIGDPLFFISPTKFVCSSMIYDIATKTSSPLLTANDPRLYCLTEVPQHTDYAFFMTKAGLELWNIKTNQALRRWPSLTTPGLIRLSPDLKVFSFQRDQVIEFWHFDPAWLKP
jgi:hypothetical protein